jgi:hypothetical protein
VLVVQVETSATQHQVLIHNLIPLLQQVVAVVVAPDTQLLALLVVLVVVAQ